MPEVINDVSIMPEVINEPIKIGSSQIWGEPLVPLGENPLSRFLMIEDGEFIRTL